MSTPQLLPKQLQKPTNAILGSLGLIDMGTAWMRVFGWFAVLHLMHSFMDFTDGGVEGW